MQQMSPPGIRGSEPRDERSECKPGRAQPVRNEASGVVLKKRERSEPPYVFAERSLLENKDALSRDFKGSSLRSRFFSTTRLASFLTGCALPGLHSLRSLGSSALLSQEGTSARPKHSCRFLEACARGAVVVVHTQSPFLTSPGRGL